MPSPCEVVPESAEFVVVSSPTAMTMRGMPSKLIPAVAGSAFAGILLVVLGCTPMFKPATAQAQAQQPTIVKAQSDSLPKTATSAASTKSKSGATIVNAASPSNSTVVVKAASGSIKRDAAIASSGDTAHSFTIDCNPAHENEDAVATRPERVALQGIMAGHSSKAALLDGVLYREGDRFGSRICPWTVAMIDVASVRIEKAFGDRTCGVTIRFQQDNAAQRTSR